MSVGDDELLYAIWSMEVLVSSGVGLESAVKHVAESDYGRVSAEFKKILKRPSGLEASLDKSVKGADESLKKVLTAILTSLREGSSVADALRTLATREAQKRNARMIKYIKSLTTISEFFLIFSMLIPIVVIIIPFMAVNPTSPEIIVHDWVINLVRIILTIDTLILCLMIIGVKLKEA